MDYEFEIAEVYNNALGIVTIISDDGRIETVRNLRRIFQYRNMNCTVAGVARLLIPRFFQYRKELLDGTINLVNHSFSHVRLEEGKFIAKSECFLHHEILGAGKWIKTLGAEDLVFVCPENVMCSRGYDILKKNNYYAVRKGARGYNTLSPEEGIGEGQWFNLRCMGICDAGVDLDARNHWIDEAISGRRWCIEMWHNVMPEDDGKYQTILVKDAEKHLDYILSRKLDNKIWVASFLDAVKYIKEKQNAIVKIKTKNSRVVCGVELKSGLSKKVFNFPLTINIKMADGLEKHTSVNVKPGEWAEVVF